MSAPPVPPGAFTKLRQCVSAKRLEAYRQAGAGDLDTLTRYVWNTCLSETLYPAIQNLEIGLRNTLHAAGEKSFGNALWFKGALLYPKEQSQVADAEQILQRQGKPLEPGRLVAELNFGFWTSLFDSRYDRRLLNRPDFLRTAFPYMPRRLRTRHTLSRRFTSIRRLRNRIFHHERILHQNVRQNHADMLEALGWINPTLEQVTRSVDRFNEVLDPAYRATLETRLQGLP